jgi:hypothetical protein
MKERHRRNQKNVKGADKVFRKLTLESLGPFLQLNWRRTLIINGCNFSQEYS